jgi:N-methylhydantoinase A
MVNAIRLVSIDRGLDPREFTLVSFGGAGSLHAPALAEIIGAREVLIPIHQGVFSAFGLMTADMRVDESVTASFRSDLLDLDRVNAIVARLNERALARIAEEGYGGEPVLESTVELRYLGQNYSTDIPLPAMNGPLSQADVEEVYRRFHAEHRRLYGYDIPDEIVEFVHFKTAAIGPTDKPRVRERGAAKVARAPGERQVYFRAHGGWLPTVTYDRESLEAGSKISGPAVVEEAMATTLVHPGQTLDVDRYGNFVLTTSGGAG